MYNDIIVVVLSWPGSYGKVTITADEFFKFEFDFCPRGYLFDTTIDKKVCSWQFVFIGYSGKI